MIDIVPVTEELMRDSEIPYDLPDDQFGEAAAFVKNGKVIGIAAFREVDGELLTAAYVTDELKKHPMAFHRVAARTLKVLHKKYDKIYAPGKADNKEWLFRLGFTPCTDPEKMFGEKEGYVKCHKH